MPEKNGCTVIVGEACEVVPVHTLSTAFWLLSGRGQSFGPVCQAGQRSSTAGLSLR